jgi:hypothetical protein
MQQQQAGNAEERSRGTRGPNQRRAINVEGERDVGPLEKESRRLITLIRVESSLSASEHLYRPGEIGMASKGEARDS